MDRQIERLQRQVRKAIALMESVGSELAEINERRGEESSIERTGTVERFDFLWPDGREAYSKATSWRVAVASGAWEVKVGHARRRAWGRNRKRLVVFGPAGPRSSSIYPWAEFVETDDGRFSAIVPDPTHPRRILRAGAILPPYYDDRTVARADELFASIANGASLRVIVKDEEEMVRHAYYVAHLKGRV